MTWVTVAEAATITGKSKRLIYNLINDRKIRTADSNAGKVIELDQLRRVLANRRPPGRPKKAA